MYDNSLKRSFYVGTFKGIYGMSISSHKLEIEQVKDLQTDLDSKQSTGSYVTTDTTQVVKGQNVLSRHYNVLVQKLISL